MVDGPYKAKPASTQENWVNAMPALGADLSTPDPTAPQVYRWSDTTKAAVASPGVRGPLTATLQVTKNDPDLKDWCYAVQSGTTCVGGADQPAPALGSKFDRPSSRLLAAGDGGRRPPHAGRHASVGR